MDTTSWATEPEVSSAVACEEEASAVIWSRESWAIVRRSAAVFCSRSFSLRVVSAVFSSVSAFDRLVWAFCKSMYACPRSAETPSREEASSACLRCASFCSSTASDRSSARAEEMGVRHRAAARRMGRLRRDMVHTLVYFDREAAEEIAASATAARMSQGAM